MWGGLDDSPSYLQGESIPSDPTGFAGRSVDLGGLYTQNAPGGTHAGMSVTNPVGQQAHWNQQQPVVMRHAVPGAATPVTVVGDEEEDEDYGSTRAQRRAKRKGKTSRDVRSYTKAGTWLWRQYGDESIEALRTPTTEGDAEWLGQRFTQASQPSMWGDLIDTFGTFSDYKKGLRHKNVAAGFDALTSLTKLGQGLLKQKRKKGKGGSGGGTQVSLTVTKSYTWAWVLGGVSVLLLGTLGVVALTRSRK
jgi:hypothetical protein